MSGAVRTIIGVVAVIGGLIISTVAPQVGIPLMLAGANMLYGVAFGPKAMDLRQRGVEQNIASPLARLPVVYGTGKVGLKLVDIRVWGSDNKKLTLVGALCHGASLSDVGIEDVREVYFDGKLAFDAAGVITNDFKKSGVAKATMAIHFGSHTEVADSTLLSNHPGVWTAEHRGRGVAYLVLTLIYHSDIYGGYPDVTVVVRGTKVMTATNTFAWGSSPAWNTLDYILNPVYGLNAGRRVPALAAWATGTGLGAFTAANVVDGSFGTKGFNTNAAVPGAVATWNFQAPVEMDRVDIIPYLGQSQAATWKVEYSDNGSSWTAVVSLTCTANQKRPHNMFWWFAVGAHQYWRLNLQNTPGAGVEIAAVDWYETEVDYASFTALDSLANQQVYIPPDEAAYKAVTAVPFVSPLRFTVATHGYINGDYVQLSLTPGSTASGITWVATGKPVEPGTYPVTVVDGNNFTVGVVATGTYTAGTLRVGKTIPTDRFLCDGVVDTSQAPGDILASLLSSCRGSLVWQGGKWRVFVKQVSATVLTLTEDDILGDFRFTIPGNEQRWNAVEGSYLKPGLTNEYAADVVHYPQPEVENAYLIADNYFDAPGTVELPFTQERYHAEAIARVVLRETRSSILASFEATGRALLLQPGDVVGITHATPGWSNKPFWVLSITLLQSGRTILAVQEYEPTCYSDDDALLFPKLPNTSLPNSGIALPPTSFALLSDDTTALLQPDGRAVPRVLATWVEPVDPFIHHYELQFRKTADTDWISAASPVDGDTSTYFGPVEVGVSYTVQILMVNTLGRRSTVVTGTITPSALTIGALANKQLVRNGDAEAPKSVNWLGTNAGWDRSTTDLLPPDGSYTWQVSVNAIGAQFCDDYLPVDTEGAYELTVWARQVVVGSAGAQYVGVACYDAQKRAINYEYCYAPGGVVSNTTLAANVNGGDTTITLTSAAAFPDESGTGFNTYAAVNANDTGTDFPNFTTYRYTSKTGNVLNLTSAIPGVGLIAASGTKVRFHRAGANYNYLAVPGVAVASMPTVWTKYRGVISRESAISAAPAATLFRPTTAFVRVFVMPNHAGTGTNTVRFDSLALVRLDEALWRGNFYGYLDADLLSEHLGLEASTMLVNGSGQSGVPNVQAPGWTKRQGQDMIVNTDGIVRTGDRCLKITHASATASLHTQLVAVNAGDVIMLGGWLKTVAPGNKADGLFRFYGSTAYGTGITNLQQVELVTYASASFGAGLPLDGVARDWSYVEQILHVISGSGTIGIGVLIDATGGITGTFYLDGLSCIKLPPGLYSLFKSGGTLKDSVLQVGSDGTTRNLVKGKQFGTTHHDIFVVFPEKFAETPHVKLSGGLSTEPRSMWGTEAAVNGGLISAATTATPIVCTLTAHGLVNGNEVGIHEVLAGTLAGLNLVGKWTVTRIDGNNFSLNGSVGAGTYVANSTRVSQSVTAPSAVLPMGDYFAVDQPGPTTFRCVALLEQRAGTLTDRSATGGGTNAVTVIGNADPVDLGAANVPSNNNAYTVNIVGSFQGSSNNFGILSFIFSVETNDGSGWVERAQSYNSVVLPGGGTVASQTLDGQYIPITVAGLLVGANDDIRVKALSLDVAGPYLTKSFHFGISTITWKSGGGSSFASKTPDGQDDIRWEAEGYI